MAEADELREPQDTTDDVTDAVDEHLPGGSADATEEVDPSGPTQRDPMEGEAPSG